MSSAIRNGCWSNSTGCRGSPVKHPQHASGQDNIALRAGKHSHGLKLEWSIGIPTGCYRQVVRLQGAAWVFPLAATVWAWHYNGLQRTTHNTRDGITP
mmetsp:Transcript_14577/g.39465  ORF Transcript_14577/g.39465 Transcript_14577/m.39465 type:complete len:98 (+) Transcript_14577:772-1065(+)